MTAEQTKTDLKLSLQAFASGNFTSNALSLFQALGYVTERQAPLHKKTKEEFRDTFISAEKRFDETKARFTEWKYVDLLFQLSKEEVLKQTSLFDTKKVDSTVIETYLFFAIELSKEQYSRTELSLITREVNRLFPMPAMILFRHGGTLTLSVINRRLHKRDETKDVLEKVTLIKDINTANPHRAHIEILFDLSFDELKEKFQFTNFVELHNAWQKTLDTKELNKRFFNELANWYFWATSKVSFPDDELKDKDVRNATGVIRLITRLMFVWFLKEKNLVPDDFFDEKKLKQLLKYTDHNKSTYYKAILQNLFFATLNTEMGKRKFRSAADKSQSSHYFIHNFFRYEQEFTKPKETLEKYFDPIPFLNGGLFECLDKQIEVGGKLKAIRIDGFSDREDNVLKVPDELFFSEKEKTIDLSKVYGTPKKSKEKVRGLIDILSSYKFTIAENTPIEEEVALDPELLGKVFENLLANYNPETQTTARKQTGSFYTPREIVNYMVDESLIAYLKQQSTDETTEEKIRDVLSYSENPNPFNRKETERLIHAIDYIKIIDPACGSGAFPMGILHKLVHVLHKLDPRNELWKQRQIEKASAIDDITSREAAIESIEEAFENNELDYGRKLYLIENCIYGVDIQPIAVQIAKLRFFISLIVEQRTNPKKENLGVRPLPNLETKFVAANTLMELEKENANLFTNPEIDKKKEQLKKVRHDYFEARTPKRKENCRAKDKQLRDELAQLLIDSHDLQPATAKKVAAWNPYDQNASANFYDSEWMFGIKNGFHVVIGNPPWVTLTHKEIGAALVEYYKRKYSSAEGFKLNLFPMFVEESLTMLRDAGISALIIPNRLLDTPSYKGTRKKIIDLDILTLESLPSGGFEQVVAGNIILLMRKSKRAKKAITSRNFYSKEELTIPIESVVSNTNLTININRDPKSGEVVNEISKKKKYFLKDICFVHVGMMVKEKDTVFTKTKNKEKIVEGKNLDRYKLREWKYFNPNEVEIFGGTTNTSKHKFYPKLFVRKTGNIVLCSYDDKGIYAEQSVYLVLPRGEKTNLKFLCAYLNSKLTTFFFQNELITNPEAYPYLQHYDLENIPVPYSPSSERVLANVFDFIYASQNTTVQSFFERLVDAIVYELFFSEAMQKGKCEVLKYLGDLPELKDDNDIKTVEKVYSQLSNSKPLKEAFDKMDGVEEIRIIEGKQ